MKRRQFLRRSAAVAAGVLACPAVLRGAALNSQLEVACIGVGGMGAATMKSVASHPKVKIVALCDVDDRYLGAAAQDHPDASRHKDWRELLGKHAERFDAVTIATPDHMHAAPAVVAIRAGKHVYLQKPMAGTLHECRLITQEAAKAGVVTQLGNQGRSSVESRMTVELLRGGAIGKIKEVILWENKRLNWWPKNTELRPGSDPVPAGLDWDLWLGVRQPRPYLENTYHPKNWRAWFDFGVGEMGDMGCHHFDTSFDALRLSAPLRVRQTTSGSSGPLWGQKRVVELVFPGTDLTADKTVQLTWYDGGIEPDLSRTGFPTRRDPDRRTGLPTRLEGKSALLTHLGPDRLPLSATLWLGERGAIYKPYGRGTPIVLPEEDFPAEKYPADIPPQDHYHDWVDAILAGRKSCADFSHGGPLTESVLVGALADRLPGQWLDWDRAALQFPNSPAATALVRREYREGWHVEGLG